MARFFLDSRIFRKRLLLAFTKTMACPLMGWSGRPPTPAASDACADHKAAIESWQKLSRIQSPSGRTPRHRRTHRSTSTSAMPVLRKTIGEKERRESAKVNFWGRSIRLHLVSDRDLSASAPTSAGGRKGGPWERGPFTLLLWSNSYVKPSGVNIAFQIEDDGDEPAIFHCRFAAPNSAIVLLQSGNT
jgi:hypothetical protein